jgi:hypothetical protein
MASVGLQGLEKFTMKVGLELASGGRIVKKPEACAQPAINFSHFNPDPIASAALLTLKLHVVNAALEDFAVNDPAATPVAGGPMGWLDRFQCVDQRLDVLWRGKGVLAFGGHGHLWYVEILALGWAALWINRIGCCRE